MKIREFNIVAYYLPQYHAIPENDEWWGKGFTEWTNVAKARPLFRGHRQPHIPADLGFYNLLHTDDQLAQIKVAREAGITAFCYWHYWFGDGKLLLEKPIKNVLEHSELDMPFCFGWANESWMAKVWSEDVSAKGKVLIEQSYPGDNDIIAHFEYLKPYLQDHRYFKIEGKPVFVIYRPYSLPDQRHFISLFNKLIKDNGIADKFYFIGHTVKDTDIINLLKIYDAVNIVRYGCYRYDLDLVKKIPLELFKYKVLKQPLAIKYKKIIKHLSLPIDRNEKVIPTIVPNWDHTPRSGRRGSVYTDVTPELFEWHVRDVISKVRDKQNKVVFLKSWNEWGEGNYLEPDIDNGHTFLEVLRHSLEMDSF